MKRIGLLLACGLLLINGTVWAMTAEEVLAKTGLPGGPGLAGGLCCFPRASQADEPLVLELAKRPTFIVHALSPDASVVAHLRDAAEAQGVLGRSLYAEKGAAPLPLADRLADLLIVSDLRDADLKAELLEGWLRVLAPRRGRALVGRAKAAGAGLSQEALKAWTKDLPLAKVIADETGVWALLRTELPKGSDPWSHRCHGPDNAQVSDDATLKPPFLTQWWGMPRQEGFWGTTVVAANGRMFSLRGSRNTWESVFLTARGLNNGIVLWQKLLRQAEANQKVPHGGYIPGRSCLVAAGELLFLADRDGVLCLDAETGSQRYCLQGPRPGGQIKWLAHVGGLLIVLAGDADAVQTISYQTVAANPFGRDIAVYEAGTQAPDPSLAEPPQPKELWRQTLEGDVDERLIAVRDERLYSFVQGVGMACRELRGGKVAWTHPEDDLQAEFHSPESKKIGELLFSQPALMALEDVLLLRARWAKNVVALSRKDGQVLWKKPESGGRALTSLAVSGVWLGGHGAIELTTGKPTKEAPKFIASGCGPTTATPGLLISCFGKVSDIKTNKLLRNEDIKSPCDVGSLVAEGMMVTVPSECGCNYEVKGYRALASAGSLQPHAAPDWKDRLSVLDEKEPAELAATDADWPTYRHDAQRSAASPASVGAEPKLLWQWKPANATPYSSSPAAAGPRLAGDFLPTAAVGGRRIRLVRLL